MASSAAAVRTAFSAVFNTDAINAYTERSYDYDLLALIDFDNAGKYLSKAKFEGDINFVQWLVQRVDIHRSSGAIEYNYSIQITYTRQDKGDSTAYKSVQDFWNTLLAQVSTTLGKRITDTVSGYLPQEEPAGIELVEIDGAPCWQSVFTISAFS